ncbi:MAG: haloacid dehalogenase-like hydrolase, partial [Betaproteobacteria bacterium]
PGRVFFELTKGEKLARIGTLGCTHFIDDLPEILLASGFPPGTARILFDPDMHHEAHDTLLALTSWVEVRHHFENLWAPTT